MRFFLIIGALICLRIAVPDVVFAQAPDAMADDAAPEQDARDQELRARIKGIFSEIETLKGVTVTVDAGVVTLTGLAPSADAIARATTLAGAVDGVVTVENMLERDVSLDTRLSPAIETSTNLLRDAVRLLPLMGVALLAFFLVSLLGRVIAGRKWLWARLAPNAFVADLIATTIRVAAVLMGIVVALSLLDLTAVLGAFLGAAGVIGLAIGFAVRDTIENYLASVMLSIRQPFKPNDHVIIDGNEGRVIRLSPRATILLTMDGNHLRIPNAQVFKSVILNYSRNPQRRFEFALGVDANDNPLTAIEAGLEVCAKSDFILNEPSPTGFIREVGDSNIVIVFMAWIDQRATSFAKARSATIAAVKDRLEADGYALPEPIYRLRFDESMGAIATRTVDDQHPAAEPDQKPTKHRAQSDVNVEPERDIEQAVEIERATTQTTDLLSEQAAEE